MRAMVTGGSGFCGQPIAEQLIREGFEVVIYDMKPPPKGMGCEYVEGTVLSPESLANAIKGCDSVYHCAGELGTHELFGLGPKAVDVNVKGTLYVLEAAQQFGVKKFMYPAKPYQWINAYTVTKQAGEEYVKMFGHVFGMDIRILRWLNVYGPGQKIGPVRKAVPLMIVQALQDYPIEIYGRGDHIVDLQFTHDMAKVTVDYVEKTKPDCVKRDLGLSHCMTVLQMAEKIIEVCDSDSKIRFIPMRMGEYSVDPKETLLAFPANEMLNRPHNITPLEDGLYETAEWYGKMDDKEHLKWLEFHGCERS